MNLTLKAKPLDATALAPYATVLKSADGKAQVFPEVMDRDEVPGAHAFTVLCPKPATLPVSIVALERHPHSTQSFVPLESSRWLILVAPKAPDGAPDLAGAAAYLAGPEEAICIGRDVWHAGLTVFDRPAQFGMIMWKATDGEDGVLHHLAEPIRIEL